ncbi:hypothetical protein V1520DRAFT_375188 [Lipomyces starkeyi]|uniref:Uncharacterized protein n=1 Tax=Lipomyces starkeyi NRRL Y-11557 TaxID=675824 RepID=A0A1E3Q2I7_LIPST|nr:hypothetical protein LIPSTDRAFT_338878 [Lipomyces starkeyi NRRL Y-11557]
MSSSIPNAKAELKILTPIGMLGYGFSEDLFRGALEDGVDAIIIDSGSTDSGPSKLALGKTIVTPEAYRRDLAVIVSACHSYRVPVLIGSAGGDGANDHVDMFVDIIRDIISKNHYRPMNVISIYAQIDKETILEKHLAGAISPCGRAVPPLLQEDIETATRVVAQMGLEPYLKAMEDNPDFDIIVGGRAYDPSPYAAFCAYHGFSNLGINYHMGKIMECGALCSTPKSKEALATIRQDSFDITPLNSTSRCTPTSVAAHTLYEKTRPDILLGPGGGLYLEKATYEQLADNRSVRVRGAIFKPDQQYKIKLEGARPCGYHSVFMGGIRDPILISQIDQFVAMVEKNVQSRIKYPYDLKFHIFGKNAVMGASDPGSRDEFVPREICISGQARANTQAEATHVINLARVIFMHGPYPNQLATSGNFAMPYAPFDIPMGQLSEFCIYHLMQITDPVEFFPISRHEIAGSADAEEAAVPNRPNVSKAIPTLKPAIVSTPPIKLSYILSPPPGDHNSYLGDLASVIRSKNAGPYELTFDVMFDDSELYEKVKATGLLSAAVIAKLYNISEEDIIACLFWDQAKAFKTTVKRAAVSGSFGDSDCHGAAQHIPLMYLILPIPRP